MPGTVVELEVPEVEAPPSDLLETDEQPLESAWHFAEIALLIDLVHCWMYGRTDYFAGGNMFVYFSSQQVKNDDYRGPDFFFVKNVERNKPRKFWAIWDEAGRYPNLIVELLSKKTAESDKTIKKKLYEETFRTPEYFWYDWTDGEFAGWRLDDGTYQPIESNEHGWKWSQELGLWLGTWQGSYLGLEATWVRLYDEEGNLILLGAERERLQKEQERKRAENAEAELARLKALMVEKGIAPPSSTTPT